MSSTNKTTNYELSQFIGTDKPAWLSDYNGDMGKIDTGIHNAQSTATGADGKADANATKIGTLSSLTTDDKTDLVSAINEVDGHADTAQNTANSASNTANGAKTTADGIATFLDINTFETSVVTASDSATITGTVRDATNTAGSLGKIYGSFTITPVNAPTITIKTKLRPDTAFTINDFVMQQDLTNGEIYMRPLNVATNGDATFTIGSYFNGRNLKLMILPCVIFAKNFGD